MEIINVLPIPFYTFKCETSLVEKVLKKVKTFTFRQNNLNYKTESYESGSEIFYDEELIQWFEECLDKVRVLHYQNGLKLEVTDCWANQSLFTQPHHRHYHPNSIVSGVFYLNTNKTTKTTFYFDNPWSYNNDLLKISNSETLLKHQIESEAGKLILFPSSIHHDVTPNKDKTVRYSVAFNSFISGELGNRYQATYLNLKSIGLKEQK